MLLDAWHGQMAICSPKETKIFWKEGTKKREIKSFVEVKQDFILLRITAEEEALRLESEICHKLSINENSIRVNCLLL